MKSAGPLRGKRRFSKRFSRTKLPELGYVSFHVYVPDEEISWFDEDFLAGIRDPKRGYHWSWRILASIEEAAAWDEFIAKIDSEQQLPQRSALLLVKGNKILWRLPDIVREK